MRATIVGVWISLLAFTTMALAKEGCDLQGFDTAEPKHVSDTAGLGSNLNFEWASDADPRHNNRWKAWHYVKNLSDRHLSLNWEGAGLVIAFGKPLPKNGVACSFGYTDSSGYYVTEAPIKVSSGESVGAEAYVPKPEQVSSRGGEVRTQYALPDGSIRDAYALLFVTYYENTVVLEVSTDDDTSVAFNPTDFGIGLDVFAKVAEQNNVNFGQPFELNDLKVTSDDLTDTLLSRAKGSFYSISNPGAKFEFSRSPNIAAETQILLLTSDRELIAATKLMLNGTQ